MSVAGNHDLAAAGLIGLEEFNPYAAEAARWTIGQLSDADKSWIQDLPLVTTEADFTLVHGDLVDPVWNYLYSADEARLHLAKQATAFGLVGHSHVPLYFFQEGSATTVAGGRVLDNAVLDLTGRRSVANPGSVGQPRDGDNRASYAVLDLEKKQMSFHRVVYDVGRTQAKMRVALLPAYLVNRLAEGR